MISLWSSYLFGFHSDFLEINPEFSHYLYKMETLFKEILLSEDYVGNMITGELPKRLDNTLFTLIHVLGGFTTSDVINFARNANHREKKLLNKMVNDLHLYDDTPYEWI